MPPEPVNMHARDGSEQVQLPGITFVPYAFNAGVERATLKHPITRLLIWKEQEPALWQDVSSSNTDAKIQPVVPGPDSISEPCNAMRLPCMEPRLIYQGYNDVLGVHHAQWQKQIKQYWLYIQQTTTYAAMPLLDVMVGFKCEWIQLQ